MVYLGNEQRSFCCFVRLYPRTALQTLLLTMRATPFLPRDSPTVVDIMVIWIKFTHSVPILGHSFLNVNVHSKHLLFAHFQFTLIHGPSIPDSYTILFFAALDFTSIISHIHNWVLFSLWLSLFILPGAISPLFSSSIFGTYQPGKFIFQCPIFLPFHTVHGVLKARMLKRFAIPFSSGPHFVIIFHHDPSVLGGPTQHGS